MKILWDSLETFFESIRLIAVFGFMVLAVMLFLMSFFTYVVAGAGFIRYQDIITGSISPPGLIIYGLVSLVSIFSLAFLSTAVTLIVKFKRSMDDIGFVKLLAHFPEYVINLMVAWIILGVITFIIGLLFNVLSLPPIITALSMLLLWAFFIFLPQSMILKDKKFVDALRDSTRYCTKRPLAVIFYYAVTLILLFVLVLIDVIIGQFKIFWLSSIINATIIFLFVIPYLEILKANIYLTRYKLLLSGLK
ncbi:MAG: hypothetical protein J7K68_03120 [Candidatus Diapherotrites archaeon]|nr:hypothetical protein [Candidatus Diapherotrites archaeon]